MRVFADDYYFPSIIKQPVRILRTTGVKERGHVHTSSRDAGESCQACFQVPISMLSGFASLDAVLEKGGYSKFSSTSFGWGYSSTN
jgi:hypothetical protein